MSKDMPVSKFPTAYSKKERLKFFNVGESRTKQSFKDECDVNLIMKRYETTGVIQHLARGAPQYVDATSLDYQGSMELVVAAREQFMALPSKVRERFRNDPAEMLAFIEDDGNRAEAIKLGLVPEPVKVDEPKPVAVRIIQEEKPPVK